MEELQATLLQEVQRWGETALLQCEGDGKKLITIKCPCEEGELEAGLTYRFAGRWTNHYKYGRQFQAQSFVRARPHGEQGILVYLRRAPHVGKVIAKRLWDLFGSEAVSVLREDPDDAARKVASKQFSADYAREAAEYLRHEEKMEETTIELFELLAGRGFPRKTIQRAIKRWANRAADVVAKNPYQLMKFPGCGFARTDQMYLDLGKNPAKLKRQALCAVDAMRRDSNGHTWFDIPFVEEALREKVGAAQVQAVKAVKLALRAGLMAKRRIRPSTDGLFLTERARDLSEEIAATYAASMATTPTTQLGWPDVDDLEDVSDHQREQLRAALRGRIGILGGSPGGGKTFAAARLIGRLLAIHGRGSVAVVAPTGKAAVRISEAMAGYGLPIKAKTIHSYLRVKLSDVDSGGDWSFEHGEGNPTEEHFVVVDESSMISCDLMAALLAATTVSSHILFVGDVNQLPPVGHGAPLRDMIAAGLPYGELREIRRNAGRIVEVCASIRDQEPVQLDAQLDPDNGPNLALRVTNDSNRSQEVISELVDYCARWGVSTTWDVQVLVAVNDSGPMSRKAMNAVLQAQLNGRNRGKGKFWDADKVICLKNGFLPALDLESFELDEDADEGLFRRQEGTGEPQLYVANGEIGQVLEETPTRTIVRFPAPNRVVVVPRGQGGEEEGGGQRIDLAYAISGHKSQGSEWPFVIVALDDGYGARMICDRSWIYTAISRARRGCFLVGSESTLKGMVTRQKIGQRRTFLAERIQERAAGMQAPAALAGAAKGEEVHA